MLLPRQPCTEPFEESSDKWKNRTLRYLLRCAELRSPADYGWLGVVAKPELSADHWVDTHCPAKITIAITATTTIPRSKEYSIKAVARSSR
jgi:hypothetical protein